MVASVFTTALAVVLVGALCGWRTEAFSLMAPMDMDHFGMGRPTVSASEKQEVPLQPAMPARTKPTQTSITEAKKDERPRSGWLAITQHFRRIMDAQNNPAMFDRF